MEIKFTWDLGKEALNIKKHRVSFVQAMKVFADPDRKMVWDSKHSLEEMRMYCIGKVDDKILTVRYVLRENTVRIIGAGYWRKGVKYYEEKSL